MQLVPLALQARRGLVEQLARLDQRDQPERRGLLVPPALRVRKVIRGLRVRQALRELLVLRGRLDQLALLGLLALPDPLALLVQQVLPELMEPA